MDVAAILRNKGNHVSTVRSNVTVAAAVQQLRAENIGALVVSDNGMTIDGILSERDIVLNLAIRGTSLLDRKVSEVMTASVRTCGPDDQIGEIMAIMTRYRIRHLPVIVEERLAGIVSIGDVVKKRLEEVEYERDVMRDWYMATP